MTKGNVAALTLIVGALFALADPIRGETIAKERGRFADLIARLAGNDYVLGSPSQDARPYVDPTPMLHAFRHLASALAWGDVNIAARQAAKLDYEVVQFTDVDTNSEYYVLREDLDAVEAIRGWGSYVVNPQSRVDALIEVPHPLSDVHTPEIGGQVFAECEARGLLLAGAHREKADVPDLVDSVFHQVHMAWIGPWAQVTAWQIHGFAGDKHPFPQGAQVVASTGDGEIVPEVAVLDTVLEERGLRSYVFNRLPPNAEENQQVNGDVPGVTFRSLAAAKNEQGRLSRSLGGAFVHIELEGDLRSSEESRRLAGSAIAAVITSTPGSEQEQSQRQKLATANIERYPISLVVAEEEAADAQVQQTPSGNKGAQPESRQIVVRPGDESRHKPAAPSQPALAP